jgi:hypothetical protein
LIVFGSGRAALALFGRSTGAPRGGFDHKEDWIHPKEAGASILL